MPKHPSPIDDSSAFQACEIEVTPAMISAGVTAYEFALGSFSDEQIAEAVYIAMVRAKAEQ